MARRKIGQEIVHRDTKPENVMLSLGDAGASEADLASGDRPDYVSEHPAWSRWARDHVDCAESGLVARCYFPRAPGSDRCEGHSR